MSNSPSPFLADGRTQYAWDSVSITTAQECARRYQLKIIQGWQPKGPASAIALAFGILVHSGIEGYHKARALGATHQQAVEQSLAALMADPFYAQLPTEDQYQQEKADEDSEDDGVSLRNARVRTRYHLWRALVWYFEHYAEDPMPVYHLANGKPAVELSVRVPIGSALSDGTEILLSGHLDKVVEFNGQHYVSDIKTTKSITHQWRQEFDLSHQMTGYTLLGKLALDASVAGVVIDGICLQVGGVKFARHFTDRTPSQLGEYMKDLRSLVFRFEGYAAEDYYPKNTSFCRFCEFKEVCRQPPEMRQSYLNHLYQRKPAWNPLQAR